LSGSNPFATRYTQPGAVGFLFRGVDDVPSLVERLRAADWWGEITGPHGSGKSTLLAALEPALRVAGRDVWRVTLHGGQRRLPADLWRRRFTPATQLVIDGYEQLGRWQRLRIKRRCQLSAAGLLVTAHGSVGLPELYRTSSDLETATRVVRSLLSGNEEAISAEEIAQAFRAHHGDVREMLFTLYDLYQGRRRQS
jgi:hypothetical protein